MARRDPRDALLELAALLAPGDLAREVADACDAPAKYFARFKRRLDDRGIDDATDDYLPWIALVAGLEVRKRLFEIDWKSDAENTLWAIDKLLPKDRARWAWCDLDSYDNTPTQKFLAIAGRALAASGIALVSIDTGGDSYPLSTLPFERVAEAQALAKATRLGQIDSFAPRTRPEPPKPLPARKPEPKTSRPKAFRASGDVDVSRDQSSHARGLLFDTGKPNPTKLADASTWPPKVRVLEPHYCKSVAWSPSGAYTTNAQYTDDRKRQTGTLREHRDGRTNDLAVPDGVDLDRIAYAGEELVVFPANHTYRGKRVKVPLIWQRDRFRALPGLPAVVVPPPPGPGGSWSFAIQGHARTGAGSDVIVWFDRGYERAGAKWKPTFELGKCDDYDKFPNAPAGPDGFFFVTRGVLRQATRGKRARRRLPTFDRIDHISPGPDGTVLCALVRVSSKAPAGLVFFPDDETFAPIPPSAFGLRRDDDLEAIFYSAPTRLVFGIVELPHAGMRPVRFDSLLALPRRNEASGR
jgi:hypothetical protein